MSTNQNLMQHMRELIDCIKAADVAYYRDDNPTMTDREYDLLVDELKELETTTGLILSGSPTQTVPGEILKELTPVRHTKPMLSADKTKSVDEMLRFANGRPVVLSWKLDGLTIVLRYEGGEFKQAITRGREGIIGEDVTHTVRTFMNVPMCIPCTDKFEVRGEGVISWAHFEKINLSLSEPYSHPRNLAAGSVRMLDARESGKRYLEFFAFDLISDSIEEIVFPISYIINDCIAEVWGFRKARLIIWMGFLMNFMVVAMGQLAVALPAAPFWEGEESFNFVFGMAPRIAAASLAAFLVGSFINAYVMSRMKVASHGKNFSARAILSTVAGEGADSLIFFPLAFGGLMPVSELAKMMLVQVVLKTLYEVIVLPVTVRVVKYIKRVDDTDVYDEHISYNVLKIKEI